MRKTMRPNNATITRDNRRPKTQPRDEVGVSGALPKLRQTIQLPPRPPGASFHLWWRFFTFAQFLRIFNAKANPKNPGKAAVNLYFSCSLQAGTSPSRQIGSNVPKDRNLTRCGVRLGTSIPTGLPPAPSRIGGSRRWPRDPIPNQPRGRHARVHREARASCCPSENAV
jgi:hypothetical protein